MAEFPEWTNAHKARLWQQAEMFFTPTVFRDIDDVYEWLKEDTERAWQQLSPETRREIAAENPDGIFAEWLTSAR